MSPTQKICPSHFRVVPSGSFSFMLKPFGVSVQKCFIHLSSCLSMIAVILSNADFFQFFLWWWTLHKYNHYQVLLIEWIFLVLSLCPSLSSITLCRSFTRHSVSTQELMKISLGSSVDTRVSMLWCPLEVIAINSPAHLTRLICMVCQMGGKWPYSNGFARYCCRICLKQHVASLCSYILFFSAISSLNPGCATTQKSIKSVIFI